MIERMLNDSGNTKSNIDTDNDIMLGISRIWLTPCPLSKVTIATDSDFDAYVRAVIVHHRLYATEFLC